MLINLCSDAAGAANKLNNVQCTMYSTARYSKIQNCNVYKQIAESEGIIKRTKKLRLRLRLCVYKLRIRTRGPINQAKSMANASQ